MNIVQLIELPNLLLLALLAGTAGASYKVLRAAVCSQNQGADNQ